MSNTKQNSGSNNVLSIALLGITGLVSYFVFNSKVKASKAEDEAGKLVSDEPTRQASLIKNFIGSWYQQPNITQLLAIARTIKDWPAVVKAYSKLYAGENLEETIRTVLQKWGGYDQFLLELSKKGLPGTNTGNVVVAPKEVHVKGTRLLLEDSKHPVVYFKDWKDYPTKPLATVPVGKIDNAKRTVTFQQAYTANYAGSTVKTTLYQIALSNGLLVWVNADRNIRKSSAIRGLASVYNNII